MAGLVNKLSAQVRNNKEEHKLICCSTRTVLQRDTYSRFELFQYTACRSLALDRCKFVSASVMRLRENVARAIIPPVVPLSSFCVPAPSVPTRRVVHNIPAVKKTPFQLPSYLNNGLNQSDF